MSQFWFKFDLRAILRRKTLLGAAVPMTVLASGFASGQTGGKSVQLPLPVPQVIQRSQFVSHKNSTDVIHIAVSLPPSNAAALQAFVDSVSDPKSPNYKQWATPAQLGQKFGPSQSAVQAVVNYLQSNGFTIKLVGDSRLTILADATVSQAETAFQTTINNYHALNANEPGRIDYYAFSEPLQVPPSIAPSILTVCGMDNISRPHSLLKKVSSLKTSKSSSKKVRNTEPLTCTQTRTLYNTAPLYAAGLQGTAHNIAISSWDGYRLSNVPLYYQAFGLPAPAGGVGSNITVVTIDGGSGAGTPAGEGDLDIQMILGMAPLCNFTIYDGGGDLIDVLTAEQNANDQDIISESYGWYLQASDAIACHNEHLLISAQGITYCKATGDSGTTLEPYAYGDYDPEIFLVGGSVANTTSSGNRVNETAWSGGGGGWTTESVPFNVLPPFQKGKGVPTSINYRLVPDVALNAAGDTTGAYQFFLNGALTFDYDGTSFACPVFSGGLLIAEQKIASLGAKPRLGRLADAVYAQNGRSDVWYDITEGSNGTLPNGVVSVAGPYWDFTTGWGAINFANFAESIAVTAPQTFGIGSIVTFDNLLLNPPVLEGSNPIGGGSTLPYSLSAVKETLVGKIATMQATFNLNSTSPSLVYNPSNIASLTLNAAGTADPNATVTLYALNQTTGKFEAVSSVSGTAFSSGVTFTVSSTPLSKYVGSSGQLEVLVRYLVPNDRINNVNNFTFQTSQLQAVATFALDPTN